jgi:glycine/D-amino acid oxidase-like deaminating enzyme
VLIGGPSFWWHAIGGLPAPRAALTGSIEADVVIVGGGYTGLWTAYYLKQAEPGWRVVVLEQAQVGYGASGRNGGWVCGLLAGHHDAASRRAAFDTVAEVGRVIRVEGIDCDHADTGALTIATDPVQLERCRTMLARGRAAGETDADAVFVDADALARRVRVGNGLGGIFHTHYARVQPAKLAGGLASVVERLGVELYESSPVRELGPGFARTDHGDVRAGWVVRATEAYTDSLRGQERLLLPLRSSMIVTEPLSDDAWQRLGWAGAELVHDEPYLYSYVQRTADGRIALGGRGVPYFFGSGWDRYGEVEPAAIERLTRRLGDLFPAAAPMRIAHAWSGVFGVPRDWRMSVGVDRHTGLAWAGGYVGVGVAAANLSGRILRDLIRGEPSDLTRLPVARHTWKRRWEPEPIRFLAARGMDKVYAALDRREQATGREAFPRVAALVERFTSRDQY